MKMRQAKTSLLLLNLYMSNLFSELTCNSLSSSPEIKLPFQAEWINLIKSKPSLQKISPPRSGHVSFTVESSSPSRDKIKDTYIFGGYLEESNGAIKRYASNDLWKLCPKAGWIQVTQNGDIPNVRLASASAVMHDKLLLFGGWDPEVPGTGGVILDTIHEFDITTNTWKHLSDVSILDGPTSRHVAISLPDKQQILLHNHRCIDHVLLYNPTQKKFIKQKVTGDIPSSRGLHTACILNDETIVLFGGAAQNGQMSNEVFLLDITTWEWKKVMSNDDCCPSPRASPCMCVLDDDNLIVYGGAEYIANDDGSRMLYGHGDLWLLHIMDKEKGLGEWELLIPEDNTQKDNPLTSIAPGRNAASLSPITKHMVHSMLQEEEERSNDNTNENSFYFILHGGWRPFQKTFNDMFVLKITKS